MVYTHLAYPRVGIHPILANVDASYFEGRNQNAAKEWGRRALGRIRIIRRKGLGTHMRMGRREPKKTSAMTRRKSRTSAMLWYLILFTRRFSIPSWITRPICRWSSIGVSMPMTSSLTSTRSICPRKCGTQSRRTSRSASWRMRAFLCRAHYRPIPL